MTKSKWQLLLSMFAIFAILAFAAACGDDDDDDTGGTTASPTSGGTAPTSVAKPSGTITIRTVQFESWDPHFSDFNQDIEHFFMVWRGLYHLDKDSKPQPAPDTDRELTPEDIKKIEERGFKLFDLAKKVQGMSGQNTTKP